MKRELKYIVCLCILSAVCSCAAPPNGQKPLASAGLILKAEVIPETGPSNASPLIRVTFTNSSTNSFALLNHFAHCAIGPTLRVLLPDPSAKGGFEQQYYVFEKQLSLRKASPKCIILKPNGSYIFTSRVSRRLPAGRRQLRIFYRVGGPAQTMIEECRKDPNAPKTFWQGHVLSNVIEVNKKKSPTRE